MTIKYFATVDPDGKFTGFYPSDIWPTPPDIAVEITEEQYRQFFDGQSANPCIIYRLANGQMTPFTPEPPPITVAMSYAAAITSGLAVTSASNVIPPSVISLTMQQLSNLSAVAVYILVNDALPGGGASLPLFLVDGTQVDVPGADAWKEIAKATADYVAKCDIALRAGMQPGGRWVGPSNVVTIS